MNAKISNLTDALAYKLNELYDAEQKLSSAINTCIDQISSPLLKQELNSYAESSKDKILKLDRVYSYLMKEPAKDKDNVVGTLISSFRKILKISISNEMRDIMLISCLRTINYYKIAGYETALIFSWELELETASTLLEEVLRWEKNSHDNFSKIAVHDVNIKAAEYNIKEK